MIALTQTDIIFKLYNLAILAFLGIRPMTLVTKIWKLRKLETLVSGIIVHFQLLVKFQTK